VLQLGIGLDFPRVKVRERHLAQVRIRVFKIRFRV
jgi:hypothetical protein